MRFSSDSQAWIPPWVLTVPVVLVAVLAGVVYLLDDSPPYIAADDAWRLYQQGEFARVIDVREENEWRARRIAGAMSLPLDALEQRVIEVPHEGLVLLYGAWHKPPMWAYRILNTKGYRNLKLLHGGLPEWVASGYPTEGTDNSSQR